MVDILYKCIQGVGYVTRLSCASWMRFTAQRSFPTFMLQTNRLCRPANAALNFSDKNESITTVRLISCRLFGGWKVDTVRFQLDEHVLQLTMPPWIHRWQRHWYYLSMNICVIHSHNFYHMLGNIYRITLLYSFTLRNKLFHTFYDILKHYTFLIDVLASVSSLFRISS